jgi:hypothetical protein
MEDRNSLRRALRTPLGEPTEATRNAFRDYLDEALTPRDPSREYGAVIPYSRDPNVPGSTRFDLRGGLTGDFLGMLAAGRRALSGEAYNPADITAGMVGMATPSLAARPSPSTARVFGGESAQGVGNQMRRAREYLRMGYSPENVYQMTGVFRGPDGQLRFEINDAPARMRTENLRPLGTGSYVVPDFRRREGPARLMDPDPFPTLTVGDALNHPELFQRYPEIANTPLQSTGFNFDIRGAYDPQGNRMYLAGGKPEDMLSTLLHEIQHNVQNIERFRQGGNPGQFLPPQHDELRRTNTTLLNSIQDTFKREGLDVNPITLTIAMESQAAGRPLMRYQREALDAIEKHPLWDSYRTALENQRQLVRAETEAYEKYSALPGEREARTVQTRRPLSAEERRRAIPEYDR